MYRQKWLVQICVFGLLVGCGKSADDKKETTEDTNSLALTQATANEGMLIASSAIETVDDAISTSGESLAIELVEGEEDSEEDEEKAASKWCSNKGRALAKADKNFASLLQDDQSVNSADNILSATSEKFAARTFHCVMKVDSGSPETIRGSFALIKGLICGLEAQKAIDFENPGKSEGVKVEINEDCFTKTFVENNRKDFGKKEGEKIFFAVDAETKELTDEEGWDHSVTLSNIAAEGKSTTMEIEMKFHRRDGMLGILFIERDSENENRSSAWTFSLTKDGVMRYESKDFRLISEGDGFNRALRILVVGDVEVSGKDGDTKASFKGFETYQGILADIENSDQRDYMDGHLATINGSVSGGFLTQTYVCNEEGSHDTNTAPCDPAKISDFYDPSDGKDFCVGSSNECDGLKAIAFENADFLMITTESVKDLNGKDPLTWADGLKEPLSFESVTTAFSQK